MKGETIKQAHRNASEVLTGLGLLSHTAPERCQPDKFATLSFSAFLVVCDQDKKLQVGQQILKGGNFCQLISLLLHHHLSVKFTNSSWNHCFPAFSHIYDQM